MRKVLALCAILSVCLLACGDGDGDMSSEERESLGDALDELKTMGMSEAIQAAEEESDEAEAPGEEAEEPAAEEEEPASQPVEESAAEEEEPAEEPAP